MIVNKLGNTSSTFSGVTILKAKSPILINFLDDVDMGILRKAKNQQVRFATVATSTKTNGYWHGKLLTGDDVKYLYTADTKNASSIILKSINDILDIPALKKFKKQILTTYNEFVAKYNY